MKAVVFNKHGAEDVLELADVPEPEIAANEVLVRVKACALNHLDIWVRKGIRGLELAMPHILGCDVAGVVERVGELVKNTKPGDEVVLSPGLSCMHCEYCLAGRDNLCARYSVLGALAKG